MAHTISVKLEHPPLIKPTGWLKEKIHYSKLKKIIWCLYKVFKYEKYLLLYQCWMPALKTLMAFTPYMLDIYRHIFVQYHYQMPNI